MNFRIYSNDLLNFKKYRRVLYIPTHANNDTKHPDCLIGFVSSVNESHVFVKFASQLAMFGWNGTTAQAVQPYNLKKLQGSWNEITI